MTWYLNVISGSEMQIFREVSWVLIQSKASSVSWAVSACILSADRVAGLFLESIGSRKATTIHEISQIAVIGSKVKDCIPQIRAGKSFDFAAGSVLLLFEFELQWVHVPFDGSQMLCFQRTLFNSFELVKAILSTRHIWAWLRHLTAVGISLPKSHLVNKLTLDTLARLRDYPEISIRKKITQIRRRKKEDAKLHFDAILRILYYPFKEIEPLILKSMHNW